MHSALWVKIKQTPKKPTPNKKLVLHSIKSVGEESGKERSIKLQDRQAGKLSPDKVNQKGKKRKLSLSDLSAKGDVRNITAKKLLSNPKPNLKMNKNQIQNMVQNSVAKSSARELLNRLGESDIGIKFDTPKGVKIDELNKDELRLYSFQRRTAINYVNTFYKELREFEHQNPHLKFPMVEYPEVMTGRVTYDFNGDIVRIQMVRWSQDEKLQNFFLKMLKELNKLPNPPKEIVQNGEFTIYYTLNIKI